MALLGVSFRIMYQSKNHVSGLIDVSAKIKRPDGVVIGPLVLTEVADTDFEGSYTATYTPAETDPEGNYIVALKSPSEGNHKDFKTVYFIQRPELDPSAFDIAINRRQAIEAETESKKQVEAESEGKNVIADLSGSSFDIQAYFYKDELEFFLDNNEFIGEVTR